MGRGEMVNLQFNYYLSQSERDEIFETLTEGQKRFVTEKLKRGRKTLFANVLAKSKAGHLVDVEANDFASKWEFIDYLDAGSGWRINSKLFCECGRKLRYQYIVRNSKTNEVMKFGINHFEEHTGIPSELAREIVKGIERIDYEMDEVLIKIRNNWTIQSEGIDHIPSTVIIPKDITEHLEYDIPLLKRQLIRLKEQIRISLEIQEQKRLAALMVERDRIARKQKADFAEKRRQIRRKFNVDKSIELQEDYQLGIIVFLQELTVFQFWASEVCADLVTNHSAPKDTYSSGTYKIFPNVCKFLESLTEKGLLKFVEKQSNMDRMYSIVE